MSVDPEIEAKCKEISTNYSACDVSDALLKLKVPQAGFLPDILPSNHSNGKATTIVAPLSTVLFVPKTPSPSQSTPATTTPTTGSTTPIPQESNIPQDKHWTDLPAPGTIVLLQQPPGQICAVCGDILATRLKVRGTGGIVADGRVRDVVALSELCRPSSTTATTASSNSSGEGKGGEGRPFTVWSRGTSTVGTGLAAQAWCVDVPLSLGTHNDSTTTPTSSATSSESLQVYPGDIIVCDEGERGSVVIPLSKLDEVLNLLPGLKEADEKCIADVGAGVDVREAFRRHR
ncbi:hypothetical protein KC366_g18565 [Hortaea werneckii]|uniref:Uncharacterized protein n=2 Tax=Hortaea werneckii TaxID=91943 RepID=A0A3M7IEZ7_HORWE|nr:hypothetical protein KC350_g18636 [Hortaea werneckii]OTA26000.1 hypothetical protein BTJ68_11171 [Hortaea werneckii EXF-2000]KAI7005234.1 hypothetical protein KC362_g18574 [Hortaea werneckii]KAI7005451.1 hypothetical protein KC366_g18565 [Hortaea werneckii]KAI7112782.1 hypothetical protein KC337_g18525 [Hortaea werneckii]